MYGWIWRHLPGSTPVRALISLLLALGVVYLLFAFVFPWAEPLLPFGDATVNGSTSGSVQPASPSPSPGAGRPTHSTTSLNGAGAPDARLSPSSIPGALPV